MREFKKGEIICGIYAIQVNKLIVYVGQSKNIHRRIIEHWTGIYGRSSQENKYKLLSAAIAAHYPISFYLLEECKDKELNKKEEFWIKAINPILNSQHNKNNGSELTTTQFFDIILNEENRVSDAILIPKEFWVADKIPKEKEEYIVTYLNNIKRVYAAMDTIEGLTKKDFDIIMQNMVMPSNRLIEDLIGIAYCPPLRLTVKEYVQDKISLDEAVKNIMYLPK